MGRGGRGGGGGGRREKPPAKATHFIPVTVLPGRVSYDHHHHDHGMLYVINCTNVILSVGQRRLLAFSYALAVYIYIYIYVSLQRVNIYVRNHIRHCCFGGAQAKPDSPRSAIELLSSRCPVSRTATTTPSPLTPVHILQATFSHKSLAANSRPAVVRVYFLFSYFFSSYSSFPSPSLRGGQAPVQAIVDMGR